MNRPQSPENPEPSPDAPAGAENASASPSGGRTEHPRLTQTRELIASLTGHDNAVVRTAVRIALDELDRAALTTNPAEHIDAAIRALDAALNPVDGADQ